MAQMSARRCEQCENCFMHVESVHCKEATKNCNNRHTPSLLTCARCKEVRYCSRECQRAQWHEHKMPCQTQATIIWTLKLLGPDIEQAFNSFVKFCKSISGLLEKPAISALELQKGRSRVNTNVFLLTIKGKETRFPSSRKLGRGCYTFKIESAQGVTMQEMHRLLDYRAGPLATPDVTERTMAHRPGLLRIFVLETSGRLPIPLDGYTLPTDISNWPSDYHKQYDPDWQKNFLELIGQSLDDPNLQYEGVADDVGATSLPPARPSSPV
ncbi:hypothetical protein B0H34DRAFT_716748 [Crassisporium funariophilum]|nr:hypothetical protein B0H34DRAFT_716748 [Crassisporium funariophilum]